MSQCVLERKPERCRVPVGMVLVDPSAPTQHRSRAAQQESFCHMWAHACLNQCTCCVFIATPTITHRYMYKPTNRSRAGNIIEAKHTPLRSPKRTSAYRLEPTMLLPSIIVCCCVLPCMVSEATSTRVRLRVWRGPRLAEKAVLRMVHFAALRALRALRACIACVRAHR